MGGGWGGGGPRRVATPLLFSRFIPVSSSSPSPPPLFSGIAGIFHGARPGRERVYLAKRKGFVRVAIEAGVDLVPVYHFHSSLFDLAAPPGSSYLSRKLKAAFVYPAGWGGLPVPRGDPILSVVGDAVAVRQDDAPTQAAIDAAHAAFVASLKRAFDDHKHLAGAAYAKKELEVV